MSQGQGAAFLDQRGEEGEENPAKSPFALSVRNHTGSELEETGHEMTAEIWQGAGMGKDMCPKARSARLRLKPMDLCLVECGRLVLKHIKTVF